MSFDHSGEHLKESNIEYTDRFVDRHIGPNSDTTVGKMLHFLGLKSLEDLVRATVPQSIQIKKPLVLAKAMSEFEALHSLQKIASSNQVFKSFQGMGYSDTITPPVIQRNILENPGWYTQYTPYQAEIAQGRLEALLNFQTMICDLTGFEIANASLLDEGTAAAEAMGLAFAVQNRDTAQSFFVSQDCHPQTIDVLRTRAEPLGIRIIIGQASSFDFQTPIFGALLQYPATDGAIHDYREFISKVHQVGALVIMATDLLSLTLLTPPGELGADVAVGNAQRFGVPLGYGGPHPAFFATKDQFKRQVPGRFVGLSKDVDGKPAVRLALQTREQHIRRDKATSNICTSQVLLAIISSMYAVYHGPEGLKKIAARVNQLAQTLENGLKQLGLKTGELPFFDTISVKLKNQTQLQNILLQAEARRMNLRRFAEDTLTVSLDETTTSSDVMELLEVFASGMGHGLDQGIKLSASGAPSLTPALKRSSSFLTHQVFNSHHSETEVLRYMHRLQAKDLSLTHSMIPLGSCTMKLNATAEMFPVTWPEFGRIHPFAPSSQTKGYAQMLSSLEKMLCEITGFAGVSLQPNAGSQGEYAGLLVIRKYHQARGQGHRNVCLIPKSAHGTNPASAAMAGMKVIVVETDSSGNVDLADLRAKATEHKADLSALMVTYPSTHGVFEEDIQEVCKIIHDHGGQVYMDGANMNAQVGVCRPGDFGPDVCHLNLHKTFCIPHGGGGPGMGPIGVAAHLSQYLPRHSVISTGGAEGIGAVSSAPWGSASILPISWMYIAMMGAEGLTRATQVAILNANYIAKRLAKHYPVLYKGREGFVAHECIFDLRPIKEACGIDVEDVAKRLMDYGFHAPTISFPVAGTMMVEPTESESLAELDRFCEAMISIREEIAEVESGKADRKDNVLKNAPHTALQVTRTEWMRPYSREKAAFPTAATRENKFWPSVGRIDNVQGDRNFICSCPPTESYQ
jgi:glycine dehydrogenase